jgi:ribonuclease P protein component
VHVAPQARADLPSLIALTLNHDAPQLPASVPPRFTLRRSKRLTHDLEYQSVYDGRMKKTGTFLMLWAIPNQLKTWRLGLSVSKRIGAANVRVKCKRLIRESFRTSQHTLPLFDDHGLDVIVSVRTAQNISLEGVERDLCSLAAQLCEELKRRQKRKARQEEPRTDGSASS